MVLRLRSLESIKVFPIVTFNPSYNGIVVTAHSLILKTVVFVVDSASQGQIQVAHQSLPEVVEAMQSMGVVVACRCTDEKPTKTPL